MAVDAVPPAHIRLCVGITICPVFLHAEGFLVVAVDLSTSAAAATEVLCTRFSEPKGIHSEMMGRTLPIAEGEAAPHTPHHPNRLILLAAPGTREGCR